MLLLLSTAQAASLDNLEIGGVWGTPTATDASAVWWNPAGVAAGHGTRILLEGAPTFAVITFDRADPNGGSDVYRFSGVVPYAGVATDLGVRGLGIGAGLAVPMARGGVEDDMPGSGQWHMQDGDIKVIHAMLAGGYTFFDRVSVGVSGHLVRSTWKARVSTDTLPDLMKAIEAEDPDAELTYTDADLENPDYTATLQFDELADTTFTWGAGLRVQVNPQLAIGASYVHGFRVDNEGNLTISFGCPPETDKIGRFAAERTGTCYTDVHAKSVVGYDLPSRVNAAILWEPLDLVSVTAMGGWVHWSVFDDFYVTVKDSDIETEDGKALIEQTKAWARENHDSGWAGLDAKFHPHPKWTVGARVLYDASAVPDIALSTNNYDANAWMLSAMGAWHPVRPLEVGVSYTRHVLAERTVTESGYGMTIEGTPKETRWAYPHSAGTYTGGIDRFGLSVKVLLGGKKFEEEEEELEEDEDEGEGREGEERENEDDEGGFDEEVR